MWLSSMEYSHVVSHTDPAEMPQVDIEDQGLDQTVQPYDQEPFSYPLWTSVHSSKMRIKITTLFTLQDYFKD